jgi:hypothetical protein
VQPATATASAAPGIRICHTSFKLFILLMLA